EIEPNHAQTRQNLGIVYCSQGDYDRAIEAWEQLLEAHPGYPQTDQIRRQIETARLHADKAGMASRTDQ
ncbi:MAG TPA: tetratricopeptide repeat protein, partial [Acidobacteriota bacterium]|nr:tetratricopeptide repeat protein [Acidobacteriota bacterium]